MLLVVCLSLVPRATAQGARARWTLGDALDRRAGLVQALVLGPGGTGTTRLLVVRSRDGREAGLPRPGAVVDVATVWASDCVTGHADASPPPGRSHRLVPGQAVQLPAEGPPEPRASGPPQLRAGTRHLRCVPLADVLDPARGRGLLDCWDGLRRAHRANDLAGLAAAGAELLERGFLRDGLDLCRDLGRRSLAGDPDGLWARHLADRAVDLLCSAPGLSWSTSAAVGLAVRYGGDRGPRCALGQLRTVALRGVPLDHFAIRQVVESLAEACPADADVARLEAQVLAWLFPQDRWHAGWTAWVARAVRDFEQLDELDALLGAFADALEAALLLESGGAPR